MEQLTKRRVKASAIDFAMATAITLTIEQLLRKKIKNEAFHVLITPTAVQWGLEFIQLKQSGQTVGYKQQGLVLENSHGSELATMQIAKRIFYRDTIGPWVYWKERKKLESGNGAILPQDRFSGTIVRETKREMNH
ncbi:RDD family protein [Planococcus lenghuensis]|uniref:RDD family protein n=1 Tax=Planococcus lenghuensis TaxID=2213202 RepID=A0A1Q2KX03_9BACL|nr:RDD family protein [Planococcus lenghuensis]AQQ52347.1 RDD family protein [Planococcus lenghuensis]